MNSQRCIYYIMHTKYQQSLQEGSDSLPYSFQQLGSENIKITYSFNNKKKSTNKPKL